MQITVHDNTQGALQELNAWKAQVLEKWGMEAERRTADNIRNAGRVDTSRMINSITHTVIDDTVYVGSNVEYMPYHEFGTGKFASDGNGRQGWWVYVPGDNGEHRSTQHNTYTYEEARAIVAAMQAQGIDAHMTQGIKPIHALRDAIANNLDVYKRIAEETT